MRTIFSKLSGLMLVPFSLALVLMTFGAAPAKESATTKTFVVVGTAALDGGNVTAAREKAISDGLVSAVALMTKELLEVESLVENFSQLNELLFDQTNTFIQGYKVLSEAGQNKSYRVIIQATVSGDKISKKLTDAGILQASTNLPSVLFLIAEQNLEQESPMFWWSPLGSTFISIAEAAMVERLQEAGFTIVNHRGARNRPLVNWDDINKPDLTDLEAAELGAALKADVIILGTSSASPSTNIMGSAMRSFNGTVTLRALRSDSAEPLLNMTRTAVAVSNEDAVGGREALADAGATAGPALAEELISTWQKQAGRPSVVEVVILGTNQLVHYVKFRKALNTISGVEGIRVKEIKPNEATLQVEYIGKPQDLAAALMQQNFQSFGINIFEVTPEQLKVELIPG
ncbi:MAG: hypothetical protein V2I56_18780 [Desulfobacteraceae bacterium]|jgi:hypothetical protein|nr:hypothetical protein [Desulfobacteraceae bacterium]